MAGGKTGKISASCSPRGNVILSDGRSIKDHVELARKLNGLCRVKSKVKTHVRNAKLCKFVKLLNAKFGKSRRRNIGNEVDLSLFAELQKSTSLSAIINPLFLGNL